MYTSQLTMGLLQMLVHCNHVRRWMWNCEYLNMAFKCSGSYERTYPEPKCTTNLGENLYQASFKSISVIKMMVRMSLQSLETQIEKWDVRLLGGNYCVWQMSDFFSIKGKVGFWRFRLRGQIMFGPYCMMTVSFSWKRHEQLCKLWSSWLSVTLHISRAWS